MRRVLITLLAAGASMLGLLGIASPAHATSEFIEHINSFDVTLTVAPNGLLSAHEVIEYNFGVAPRHGIFRDIPVREVWTSDNAYERVYDVKVKKVTATGASAATKVGRQ